MRDRKYLIIVLFNHGHVLATDERTILIYGTDDSAPIRVNQR